MFKIYLFKTCPSLLLLLLLISFPAQAAQNFGLGQAPSSQQLEAFKKLSPSEQQRLAKQLGITLPVLQAPVSSPDSLPLQVEETIKARNTQVQAGDSGGKTRENETKHQQGLKQYGYDLFAGAPTTFAPATDIPIPTDYVIGPGDTVKVQLYGKENAIYELMIDREGVLQFPDIGPLTVAGLSFQELKAYLNEIVAKQMIGVKASITMGALRSIRVFVLGEAYRPGSYTISALSTITNALFVSGGVTKVGSLRNIQLKRKGKTVGKIDLYDLLHRGDTSGDQRLQPGDVIFIPPIGKTAGVTGQVRRPAIYELKDEKTAVELIQLAGGYLPTAYPPASRVERINPKGQRTIVDLDLATVKGRSEPLKNGDVLEIFPVLGDIENAVMVSGHLYRPGGFAWKPGLRVSNIISSVHQMLPSADLDYALIVREKQPERTVEARAFSIGQAINKPGTEQDPVLLPRDKVLVFGLNNTNRQILIAELISGLEAQAKQGEPVKIVSISGHVRVPGVYPLTKGMTAAELITAAGGFTEKAYGLAAEITRAELDGSQYQNFKRIALNLDQQSTDINTPLVSRDQLYIKRIPNWNERETATINGEVNFPGKYPIFKGDTVVDLIARAGGLTEFAEPNAAIFLREHLRQKEQEQLNRFQQQIQKDVTELKLEAARDLTGKQDAAALGGNLVDQLLTTRATGRLVIDLQRILHAKSNETIKLKNNDALVIPQKSSEITVLGEVQFPTSHLYSKNTNVYDYIYSSGGYTAKADKKRIYIIKANGRVAAVKKGWFARRSKSVAPGDTIIVPFDVDKVSGLTYWANISHILFNLSTTVAALKSIDVF